MRKIEVFIRHCYHSDLKISSQNRPNWWDKEAVFKNFKRTLNPEIANYTVIFDEFHGSICDTFLRSEKNVHVISCGKESDSFCKTLEYVLSKKLHEETIVYFLEDDYVHRPGWSEILLDGFTLPVDYVTLYDHGDKYQEVYKDFMTKVLKGRLSHWMPTPSTTNTFATKMCTLHEDRDVHMFYSTDYEPSFDHGKFIELHGKKRRNLISCIPGYSTHCHKEFLSPCIDWSKYI